MNQLEPNEETKVETTSSFLRLNLNDFVKGLVVAVLAGGLGAIYDIVDTGSLELNWDTIKKASLVAGVGYLLKNLGTPSKTIVKMIVLGVFFASSSFAQTNSSIKALQSLNADSTTVRNYLKADSAAGRITGWEYYNNQSKKWRIGFWTGSGPIQWKDLINTSSGNLSGTLTSPRIPFASATHTLTDVPNNQWNTSIDGQVIADDPGTHTSTITGGKVLLSEPSTTTSIQADITGSQPIVVLSKSGISTTYNQNGATSNSNSMVYSTSGTNMTVSNTNNAGLLSITASGTGGRIAGNATTTLDMTGGTSSSLNASNGIAEVKSVINDAFLTAGGTGDATVRSANNSFTVVDGAGLGAILSNRIQIQDTPGTSFFRIDAPTQTLQFSDASSSPTTITANTPLTLSNTGVGNDLTIDPMDELAVAATNININSNQLNFTGTSGNQVGINTGGTIASILLNSGTGGTNSITSSDNLVIASPSNDITVNAAGALTELSGSDYNLTAVNDINIIGGGDGIHGTAIADPTFATFISLIADNSTPANDILGLQTGDGTISFAAKPGNIKRDDNSGNVSNIISGFVRSLSFTIGNTVSLGQSTATAALIGALTGDSCLVTGTNPATGPGIYTCFVSSANNVTIVFSNTTIGAVNPGTISRQITLFRE